MYAWKRLSDGEIAQQMVAKTAHDLFEQSGFGAVDVDKPLKGYLAVPVRMEEDETLVEVEAPDPEAWDRLLAAEGLSPETVALAEGPADQPRQ